MNGGGSQAMGPMGGMGGLCGPALSGSQAMSPMGGMGAIGGMCNPAQSGIQAMGPMGGIYSPAQSMGMPGFGTQQPIGGKGGPIMGVPGFGHQALGSQGAHGFGHQSIGSMGGMGGQLTMGGKGGPIMGAPGFGHQAMGSQGAHGFGPQPMANMPFGGWNGNMPFQSIMASAKPSKQGQPGKRPASGFGAMGHVAGKRKFATQASSHGMVPYQFKLEVLQTVLPEVWNPVTAASKTLADMDCAMGVGFDRWHGSPLETRSIDEWVTCIVIHYNSTGRRLHGKSQLDINTMAEAAYAQLSSQWAAHDGHQAQPGFQVAIGHDATSHGHGASDPVARAAIIMTPEGRPMAMSKSQGRLLHRAESGGANDWELVQLPDGREFIRSPSQGQSEWLDMVVTGQTDAWPSPPPADTPEQVMARLAQEEMAAITNANALAAEAKAIAEANAITMAAAVPDYAMQLHLALTAKNEAMAMALRVSQLAEEAAAAKDQEVQDMGIKYRQLELQMALLRAGKDTEQAKAMAEKQEKAMAEQQEKAMAEQQQKAMAEQQQKATEENHEKAMAELQEKAMAEKQEKAMAEQQEKAMAEKHKKAMAEQQEKAMAEKQEEEEEKAMAEDQMKFEAEMEVEKQKKAMAEMEMEKLEKQSAWDAKMKLALQKEAADDAHRAEHNSIALKAMEEKFAKKREEATSAIAIAEAKDQAEAEAAKVRMDKEVEAKKLAKDEAEAVALKANSLLSLMAQQGNVKCSDS